MSTRASKARGAALLAACALIAAWGGSGETIPETDTTVLEEERVDGGEEADPTTRGEVLASIARSGTYLLDVGRIETHIHAQLTVTVDGQRVVIAQTGVDFDTLTAAPIHTHDTTGVLHVETDEMHPEVPSVQDFLEIWKGVSDLDGLCRSYGGQGGCQTEITVNGSASSVLHQPADGDDIRIEIERGTWA